MFVACFTLYMYLTSDNLFADYKRHVEIMIMMINHAGNVFKPCIINKS